MTASGPYDTEAQARSAALAAGGPARPGWSILSAEQNRLMLAAAIAGAGVETARYDDRIIEWLAGYEDSACAVIAALITRAHQSVISPADLATVRQALADAIASREDSASIVCASPAGECPVHKADHAALAAYRELAARIGGDVPGPAGDSPDAGRATSPEVANIIGDYARSVNAGGTGDDPVSCGCPAAGGVIRHQRDSCTDPVARRLDWFAS